MDHRILLKRQNAKLSPQILCRFVLYPSIDKVLEQVHLTVSTKTLVDAINPFIGIGFRKMDDSEEYVDRSFLPNCFFIVDDVFFDERAADDELIAYFYPPAIESRKQFHLVSSLQHVLAFIVSFTKSCAKVVELMTFKLAYRVVGKSVVALTASSDCSNKSVKAQLDRLVFGMHFYCKSLDNLEQKAQGDRKKYIQSLASVCNMLSPLVDTFHVDQSFQFHPLRCKEFSGLSPVIGSVNTSRLFVNASQIISSVIEQTGILGACVLHQNSTLCSYFDMDTTMWIINYIQMNRPTNEVALIENVKVYFDNVCMKDLLQKKYDLHNPYEEIDFQEIDKSSENTEALLFILSIGDMSLASIGLISLDTKKDDLLASIEQDYREKLEKLGEEIGKIINSGIIEQEDASLGTSSPIAFNKSTSRLRLSTPERVLSSSQLLVRPKGLTMSKDKDQPNYSYLSHSTITQQRQTFVTTRKTELKDHFYDSVSQFHDIFEDNPRVTKIILRDHTGTFYCRNIFGKETYFHQHRDTSQLPPTLKSAEDFAKETLKSPDHNITLV